MSALEELAQAVVEGNEKAIESLVKQTLDGGVDASEVLNDGLLKGMSEVGRRFRDGEFFIPEVLVAAEALKVGTALLKPLLADAGVKPRYTAVMGTVRGDLHDIGKNLVATMLEGVGFGVVDLGVDVPAEKFIAACQEHNAQVVGLSALLTTTMPAMAETVRKLNETISPAPIILIGGAPISAEYAEKIGASGFGADASTGAELAKTLCQQRENAA